MIEQGASARESSAESTVNSGLIISGGTISAGVIAGGQGAHVTVNQGSAADDRIAQIERLIQQLRTAADELNDERAEEISADGDRLLNEAKQRNPDRGRITQLLSRMFQTAASFAPLLDIVVQLKSLVG